MSNKVIIGYVHPLQVHHVFMQSFLGAIMHDAGHDQNIAGWIAEQSGPLLARGRNLVVRRFLETEADWLWMVDTDVAFGLDTLDRLLATADANLARLLGGLYFGQGDPPFPMMFDLTDSGEPAVRTRWEPGELVEVQIGTGAGCLLIHRDILEDMRDAFGDTAYPWFADGEINGVPLGEDLTFCMRARELGYPTLVDTGVTVGHVKAALLDVDGYRQATGW